MSARGDNDIFLNISGFNFHIHLSVSSTASIIHESFQDYIIRTYHGFLIDKPPKRIDFTLTFIEKQRYETLINVAQNRYFIALYEEKTKFSFLVYYHISYVQFHIVIRAALQKLLAQQKGFIVHASCVIVRGKAYLFVGKSGAGKSTSMRMMSRVYKSFADDSVIIRKKGEKYFMYATPYPEKNTFFQKSSEEYPLGKIFFLRKGKMHSIKFLDKIEEIAPLMSLQFFISEEDKYIQQENFLHFLGNFHEFYELSFHLHNAEKMIELISEIP